MAFNAGKCHDIFCEFGERLVAKMLVFCVWDFHRTTLEFPIDMRNGGEVCYNITEDMRQVLQVLSKTCELNTYYIPAASGLVHKHLFLAAHGRFSAKWQQIPKKKGFA